MVRRQRRELPGGTLDWSIPNQSIATSPITAATVESCLIFRTRLLGRRSFEGWRLGKWSADHNSTPELCSRTPALSARRKLVMALALCDTVLPDFV
jgi:hypothetical protein